MLSRSHLYVFALLASSALASLPAWAVEGYNVNEGSELGAGASATRKSLPRFTDFRGPTQAPAVSDVGLAKPEPIVLTPPVTALGGTSNLAQTPAQAPLVQPVTQVAMPSKPLYPARSGGGDVGMPNYNALVGVKTATVNAPAEVPAAPTQPAAMAQATPPAASVSVPEAPIVAAAKSSPVLSPLPEVEAPRATEVASSSSTLPTLPPPPAPLASAKAMRDAEQKVDAVMASASPSPAQAPTAIAQATPAAAKQDSIEIETVPQAREAKRAPAVVPNAPEVVGTEVTKLPAPTIASVRAAEPMQQTASPLSNDSKKILASLRPVSANSRPERAARLDMRRVNPEVADIVKKAEEVYESSGVSIRVSGATQDVTTELGDAYEALMGGETAVAIRMYQDILSRTPTNEEALFGLAATYHRTGQVDNARPLYGRLLAQNPNHREALNNFLMLVANESPRDALEELARLEVRNPDYSPIPAQMGIIFDKLGEHELAQNKMLRAIKLSPENWVYKYNLAIMFDRQKSYADAAAIYKELINASLQGESMPIDMDALQARLNYIATRT